MLEYMESDPNILFLSNTDGLILPSFSFAIVQRIPFFRHHLIILPHSLFQQNAWRLFVSDLLNELEYVCMYISSQSAGSTFLYQSIHQIFLKTVKILAVVIAYHNKNYTDKYYTNVIYVYTYWQHIRESSIKKENQNKKKAYKYLNPKINTI